MSYKVSRMIIVSVVADAFMIMQSATRTSITSGSLLSYRNQPTTMYIGIMYNIADPQLASSRQKEGTLMF